MKNKKVLFVIANSQLSGAESQLLLLASNLNNNKFSAEICCLEGEGTFTAAVIKTGLPLHIIHRRQSFDLNRLIGLIKLVRKGRYQIVHSFNWSANQYVRIVRIFFKFLVISSERGRDYNNWFRNFIERLICRYSDVVIFNSFSQMDKYNNINSVKIQKMVIYNGIDTKKYKKRNNSYIKSILQLQLSKKLIGTVGNFSAPKNFGMFIDVCKKIARKNPNIHFLAVGDGKNKEHFQELSRQNGLDKKLTFLGRREDIEKILQGFDAFLLTSTREGMPNVILEAMASEIPVIATKEDGCNEIIQDGLNGYLVDVDNVDDMVSKTMLLLKDYAIRQKFVQNGLLTIQSKFLLEKMVARYEHIYQTY